MDKVFDSTTLLKYPAWPCVKIALKKIQDKYLAEGNQAMYDQCVKRYGGMGYRDIQIESICPFPDGRLQVCFVARHRGFARYDLEIFPVTFKQMLDEFEVHVPIMETQDDLRAVLSNKQDVDSYVIYNDWNQTFGVIIQTEALINTIPDLLGNIQFDKIRALTADYDPESMTSGSVSVEDLSLGIQNAALYIRDQYRPIGPDEDDMTVTRSQMVAGISTLTFTLGKKLEGAEWVLAATHPDFDADELVINPDGKTAKLKLTLKRKAFYPGKREIKGKVTVNGVEFEFDKSFDHSPPNWNSMSCGNLSVWKQIQGQYWFGGGVQANTLTIPGKIFYDYNEGGEDIHLEAVVTSLSGSSDRLTVVTDGPGFNELGEFNVSFLVDGANGDTSNWIIGSGARYLNWPEGATGIIAIPEPLEKTEVEYLFKAKVAITFNDPARTPIKGRIGFDATVLMNETSGERFNITQTTEGYELKFTNLSEVDVQTVLSTVKVTAYEYIKQPSTWFEHRYGYTGPEGVVVNWERMTRYRKRGVFKLIKANGITDGQATWKNKNLMPGIWSSISNISPISDGVGTAAVLDMHIVDYNRPASGLTRVTLEVNGEQVDIDTEFTYTPVDVGEITAQFDPEKKMMQFTLRLPEGGITSDKVIVERDYNYGNDSLTTGWISGRENPNERTVTFYCLIGWDPNETYYRLYFSNQDDLTSVYFHTATYPHS
ncbi:hypothetical protein OBP_209 [Pseudomonas phage OBP]|uniref:hypothetical protein n=1 Tax=Pseudomonas phage OBP TaxID=1124849 RepID=UPI000240D5B5|nr:hypothetical protein OBP_209 [Pseudomonas phage OBP]AEV89646.1 hypothetical protein OBP_209 [Pseudomonas phage OBP]